MTNNQMHRINLCLMGLMVFIFLLLCVFQLVLAVLWALLCALAICLLARRSHPAFCLERDIWREKLKKIRNRQKDKMEKKHQESRGQTEFVADHKLVGIGEYARKEYIVDREVFVIGVEKSCQCVLGGQGPSTVSREHCRITYRKYSRAYYIEDLHSLNGTYLGTKRLEPFTPEKLLDNAEISISHIRFCFVRR